MIPQSFSISMSRQALSFGATKKSAQKAQGQKAEQASNLNITPLMRDLIAIAKTNPVLQKLPPEIVSDFMNLGDGIALTKLELINQIKAYHSKYSAEKATGHDVNNLVDTVIAYANTGANLNEPFIRGDRPILHIMCNYSLLQPIEYLISQGAKPNYEDPMTHQSAIEFTRAKKVDPNNPPTSLRDIKKVLTLLEKNTQKNTYELTGPVMRELHKGPSNAKQLYTILEKSLKSGLNPNQPLGKYNLTHSLLDLMAEGQKPELVELLLKHHADPTHKVDGSISPLDHVDNLIEQAKAKRQSITALKKIKDMMEGHIPQKEKNRLAHKERIKKQTEDKLRRDAAKNLDQELKREEEQAKAKAQKPALRNAQNEQATSTSEAAKAGHSSSSRASSPKPKVRKCTDSPLKITELQSDFDCTDFQLYLSKRQAKENKRTNQSLKPNQKNPQTPVQRSQTKNRPSSPVKPTAVPIRVKMPPQPISLADIPIKPAKPKRKKVPATPKQKTPNKVESPKKSTFSDAGLKVSKTPPEKASTLHSLSALGQYLNSKLNHLEAEQQAKEARDLQKAKEREEAKKLEDSCNAMDVLMYHKSAVKRGERQSFGFNEKYDKTIKNHPEAYQKALEAYEHYDLDGASLGYLQQQVYEFGQAILADQQAKEDENKRIMENLFANMANQAYNLHRTKPESR
jgi:hypothetical protein